MLKSATLCGKVARESLVKKEGHTFCPRRSDEKSPLKQNQGAFLVQVSTTHPKYNFEVPNHVLSFHIITI